MSLSVRTNNLQITHRKGNIEINANPGVILINIPDKSIINDIPDHFINLLRKGKKNFSQQIVFKVRNRTWFVISNGKIKVRNPIEVAKIYFSKIF